jgi:hypothetical protein
VGKQLLIQAQKAKQIYPELLIKAMNNFLQINSDNASIEYDRIRFEIMNEMKKMAVCDNELLRAEALATLWRNGGDGQKKWVEMKLENEFSPYVKAVVEETRGY